MLSPRIYLPMTLPSHAKTSQRLVHVPSVADSSALGAYIIKSCERVYCSGRGLLLSKILHKRSFVIPPRIKRPPETLDVGCCSLCAVWGLLIEESA